MCGLLVDVFARNTHTQNTKERVVLKEGGESTKKISSQNLGFVRWDHVSDIDEGVLSAVQLEQLESLFDQVADIQSLLLAIIDLITEVDCQKQKKIVSRRKKTLSPHKLNPTILCSEQVEDRKQLSVVRDESLSDHLSRDDQLLQDLERLADDLRIASIQCSC